MYNQQQIDWTGLLSAMILISFSGMVLRSSVILFQSSSEKESEGAKGVPEKLVSEVTVKTTLESTHEGVRSFVTVVYDKLGTPVLESTWEELDDKIVLLTRYAKPGEYQKGYGTKAFMEGPLAQSIKTGKPMVISELSREARAFYEALEQKGIASLRMTPGEEYLYKVLPGKAVQAL